MKSLIRIPFIFFFLVGSLFGCASPPVSPQQSTPLDVDEEVRSDLGVGLVAVSLLLSSGETVFFRAESMTASEKLALDELRETELATVSQVETGEGPFIRVVPTERGEEIRSVLNPKP